jgi:serine/threonine-protein kinase
VTHLADQFALGVVLWELLAQRRLFEGPSDLAIARAVMEAPLEGPSRHGAPSSLDAVVLRMLCRDPAGRFADCGEAADALDLALAHDDLHQAGPRGVAAFLASLGAEPTPLAGPLVAFSLPAPLTPVSTTGPASSSAICAA